MNWRRLYATIEICFTVGLFAAVTAGFWAFVIAGLIRVAFHLADNESMLWIFLPLFVALIVMFIRLYPKHLRKIGMLSDEPGRFGPWFKDRGI